MNRQTITTALRQAGIDGVELWYDRAAQQWVVGGPATTSWFATGTCVYRLADLTTDQWVSLIRAMATDGQ